MFTHRRQTVPALCYPSRRALTIRPQTLLPLRLVRLGLTARRACA